VDRSSSSQDSSNDAVPEPGAPAIPCTSALEGHEAMHLSLSYGSWASSLAVASGHAASAAGLQLLQVRPAACCIIDLATDYNFIQQMLRVLGFSCTRVGALACEYACARICVHSRSSFNQIHCRLVQDCKWIPQQSCFASSASNLHAAARRRHFPLKCNMLKAMALCVLSGCVCLVQDHFLFRVHWCSVPCVLCAAQFTQGCRAFYVHCTAPHRIVQAALPMS